MKLSDLPNVLDDDSQLTFDVRGVCKDGNAVFMLVPMNAWAVDQMGEANRQLNEILAQLTNLNLTGLV